MGKNPGKMFEEDFKDSIPDRCDVTRLKDAGGWSKSADLRFTIKNPCDFIILSEGGLVSPRGQYKIELKSTSLKSLPFGNIKATKPGDDGYERAIKFVRGLVDSQDKGVWAGFIVNFRDTNETFRIPASNVLKFMTYADRASFPIAWFQEKGVRIKQTLKRIRYRYDLEWL